MKKEKLNLKTRQLKQIEEDQIVAFVRANPRCDLEAKIIEWKRKYNCTSFSIMKLFVKEGLIKIHQEFKT